MAEFLVKELNTIQTQTNTSDEQKLMGKFEEWYQDSEKFMKSKRERWKLNEKLYNNQVEVFTHKGWSQIKFNLALSVINTEMSIIADYLPTFDIVGEEQDDMIFADLLQTRKSQIEVQSGLNDRILNCCEDSLNLSNGMLFLNPIIKQLPTINGGTYSKLNLKVQAIDPYTWYPAPYSTGMDIRDKCRYQMFVTPRHVDDIYKQYSKRVSPEGFIDENQSFIVIEDFSKLDKSINAKYAIIREIYFMDEDEDKYPNGRVVIFAGNDKQILDDKPLGIIVDDKVTVEDICLVPYFNLANYKSAHSIFGACGDGELIKSQIKAFNQIMSSLADNIKKAGNPIRKIRSSIWNDLSTKILGIPGENIKVNQPDDITWDIPPSVPGHTLNFLEWLLRLTESVTGIHEVSQGRRPVGITAGVAIAELQEAVQTRIRYKIKKEINPFVVEIGKYIVWLLQNYDEEVMMIRDRNAKTLSYIEYNPNKKYDAQGLPEGEEGFNPNMAKTLKDAKCEIEITQGIKAPIGRFDTEQRAVQKFKDGIYGIEEVINSLAETNKESIIDNYYKRQGLLEMKQRQEQLTKVYGEFQNFVEKAMSENGEFTDIDENNMSNMIKIYPEFLNTDEFGMLPMEVKDRLLTIFIAPNGENNQ